MIDKVEQEQLLRRRTLRKADVDRYLGFSAEKLAEAHVPPAVTLPNRVSRHAFEVALIDWRLGDWAAFRDSLTLCVDQFEEFLRRSVQFSDQFSFDQTRSEIDGYCPEAMYAAYILGRKIEGLSEAEPNLQPPMRSAQWYRVALAKTVYYGETKFTADQLEAMNTQMARKRLPKVFLNGYTFYANMILGREPIDDPAALFKAHAKLYRLRAKNPSAAGFFLFGGGEEINAIVLDYRFACIARHLRIDGEYPHLLPEQAGSRNEAVSPSRHVGIASANPRSLVRTNPE